MAVIKKHRNKNYYVLTPNGMWVRDISRSAVPEDINFLVRPSDYDLVLANEMRNATFRLAGIDAETVFAPNVVIVSDGYEFAKRQEVLQSLPQDLVTVIGTNRSLAKWGRFRRLDWYVVNNPYPECMTYLPGHSYYPRCVASTRTNPEFVSRYRSRLGVMYKYLPVPDERFRSNYHQQPLYYVDDYRNPICAAISLAARWEVQRLLLFCCDDSFADERPGAEKLPNGCFTYPQHRVSHGLVSGLLYWLQQRGVKIANCSSGPEIENVQYINDNEMLSFFSQGDDGRFF